MTRKDSVTSGGAGMFSVPHRRGAWSNVDPLAHGAFGSLGVQPFQKPCHFTNVPPAGLEPAHPAPEAGALSAELRGRSSSVYPSLAGGDHGGLNDF